MLSVWQKWIHASLKVVKIVDSVHQWWTSIDTALSNLTLQRELQNSQANITEESSPFLSRQLNSLLKTFGQVHYWPKIFVFQVSIRIIKYFSKTNRIPYVYSG